MLDTLTYRLLGCVQRWTDKSGSIEGDHTCWVLISLATKVYQVSFHEHEPACSPVVTDMPLCGKEGWGGIIKDLFCVCMVMCVQVCSVRELFILSLENQQE